MTIKTVSKNQFVKELVNDKYASFSQEGAVALYHHFEEYNIQFDPIAIRCEYLEQSLEELQKDFGFMYQYNTDAEFIERLNKSTKLLKISDERFIICPPDNRRRLNI